MPSDDFFPIISRKHVLRKLETPFIYNIPEDQLYELDEEAFRFLKRCDGTTPFTKLILDIGEESRDAIEYMLNEEMIIMQEMPAPRMVTVEQSPLPSLRYLLLDITDKCNLACRHCYLGNPGSREISIELFEKTLSQFEGMGGLKLMISGGEPLIHSGFWKLMEVLPSHEIRKVLLSNGTLIGKNEAKELSRYVDEVQVSIDGIRSHDLLRGKDSYEKAMSGISALAGFDVPVSIATMVHRHNIEEFEEMDKLFTEMNVLSWSVDVPGIAGNLLNNREYFLEPEEAALFMRYGFGAGAHESTGNNTCGSHLCAVSPDGTVSKCGFFIDEPAGDVGDLGKAWEKLCKEYLFTLDELECRDCRLIQECRGGCRFRAKQYGGILSPDPVFCHANGIHDFL